MPIVVRERKTSRESNVGIDPAANTLTLDFQVFGTAGEMDDFQARAAIEEASPAEYAGLVRESWTVKPQKGGVWEAQVRYGARNWKESVRSFDTTGGTAHINVSKETVRTGAWDGRPVPDFKGAIGVNGDTVEGCDIVIPVMAYQETHSIAAANVTQAYVEILYSATGCVNFETFRYFPEKTVLFLGAQGSQRGRLNDPWEITFKFAVSPTKTVYVGNSLNTITKEGWNHLWTRFRNVVDSDVLVRQPASSYVERVYDTYVFGLLGIGTSA